MWRAITIGIAVLGWSSAANALDCAGWKRLTLEQQTAKVNSMIDGHLNSNVGRRYTSENIPRMRRCLNEFRDDIREDFDGACAQGHSAAKNALDQIFDTYFLSCVQ